MLKSILQSLFICLRHIDYCKTFVELIIVHILEYLRVYNNSNKYTFENFIEPVCRVD